MKSTAAALHSLLKIRPVPPYPLGIMPDREPLIPPHGGYRKLKSFQTLMSNVDVSPDPGPQR